MKEYIGIAMQGMNKIKMLVVHTSFEVCGGVEKSLLTFFSLFHKEKYDIDLALFDYKQDEAKLLDAIPEHINILPALKQLGRWTPELMDELRSEGMHKEAEIKTFIRDRNKTEQFRKMPTWEKFNENWKVLKDACPLYEGYDIAVAAVNDLPLKIVATRTPGARRFAFIRIDFSPITDMGIWDKQYVLSEQIYYDMIDTIICLTDQNARSFCSLFPNLSDRVKVLPHIRDKQQIIKQANEYKPAEYNDNTFNILTVARINVQKGIDLLIESARDLKKLGVSYNWFIIGHDHGGEYSYKCRTMIEGYSLKDNVFILNEKINIFPYYKYCDLYVQTSCYEGRCGTIEEAMLLGCPIISTSFSSVTDQITDGVNGMICSFDSNEIARVIKKLYDNEDERIRIAEGNKNYHCNENTTEYVAMFAKGN